MKKKFILNDNNQKNKERLSFFAGFFLMAIIVCILKVISNGQYKEAKDIYNLCVALEEDSLYNINYEDIKFAIVDTIEEDNYIRYVDSNLAKTEEMADKDFSINYGVEVKLLDSGKLKVIDTTSQSAKNAGIKENDIILSIDDKELNIDALNYRNEKNAYKKAAIVSKYYNPNNDKIKYLCDRNGEVLEFEIDIEKTKIDNVVGQIIKDNIAYVRISEFNINTYKDFKNECENLIENGAEFLIIDLRNNPGGLINTATKIADYLLPKGIICTHVNSKNKIFEQKSDDKSINIPIYVLVNKNSASSSELLVTAIKELDKDSITVGTQTFGKTIGQSKITFHDGGYVYFTNIKNGTNNFQQPNTGYIPDYLVGDENINFDNWSINSDKQLQFTIKLIDKDN